MTEAKDFSSSLCIHISSGAHPASCTTGIGDPLPGTAAQPGHDADYSPPPVPWVRKSRTIPPPPPPPAPTVVCSGRALLCLYK